MRFSPRFTFSLLLVFFSGLLSQDALSQVSLNTTLLNYFSVWSEDSETLQVILTNNSPIDFVATDINLFHKDVYTLSDTAFTVIPGGDKTISVICSPLHNLNYMDYAMIESSTHPNGFFIQLFSSVNYNDTYYNSTQNKRHEELKSALKILLGTGYTQLTYDAARDKIFMILDNQAVNGQGAPINTLECVYTGRQATGYLTRQDAQTNDNFDTEHCFPQGQFGQALPMRSDMFHLYATWSPANNERSSKPFGIVASPTWTDGGSKSNASTFEPRDISKGKIARSMLYFVTRYQDYNGFMAPQENILRSWHETFPPDVVDSVRNEDIFLLQNNRNPFIDHPELLDRIAAIASVDSGSKQPVIRTLTDLYFGSVSAGFTLDGNLPVANQGLKNTLLLTGFVFSDPAFSFVSPPDSVISIDQLKSLPIRFSPGTPNQNYSSTLSFNTNDPQNGILIVNLHGNSFLVGVDPTDSFAPKIYPNPVSNSLIVNLESPIGRVEIALFDGFGKKVYSVAGNQSIYKIDASCLSNGIYFLRISGFKSSYVQKVVVCH